MPEIPDRRKLEAELLARLQPQFDEWRDRIEQSLGNPPNIERLTPGLLLSFEEDTALALMLLIGTEQYEAAQLRMTTEMGQSVDRELMHREAQRWANSWARRVAQEFAQNTAEAIRDELRQYEPGAAASLATVLEPILDEKRAGRLVVTELTRVATDAEFAFVQRHMLGVQLTAPFWVTAKDDRVCRVCDPLDDREITTLDVRFQAGPPAHVNCRCFVDWRQRP